MSDPINASGFQLTSPAKYVMRENKLSLLDLVDEGLNSNISGIAAATKRNGKWIVTDVESYRNNICHLAMGLHKLGVGRGDRVALHAESCTEWLLCDQAILSLGAVTVPIYTTQPGEQIRFILENSGARVYIVYNDELFDNVKPLIKPVKSVTSIIHVLKSAHEKLISLEHVLIDGRKEYEKNREVYNSLRHAVQPDDLATLIYTSGTTGRPKGVMLTHWNIVTNVLASMERMPFDIEANRKERVLSYLPLSHILERMITYMYLHMGYPIYFIEDVNHFTDELKDVKPVFFTTIPRLLEKVYAGIKARRHDLSVFQKPIFDWAIKRAETSDVEKPNNGLAYQIADKLVYSRIRGEFGHHLIGIVSGGGALAPLIMNFINAIGIFCVQGYGLTETSPVLSVGSRDYMRAGSVGKPLDIVELKLADDGEILAKGPNVMQGYYKLPDENKTAFTEGGWFRTGDIGRFDEDGYLFITDRKKALFKLSTGKYVAPQPIENRLIESHFIDQAIVVGDTYKFCAALIVPDYRAIRGQLGKKTTGLSDKDLARRDDVSGIIQQEVSVANNGLPIWEQVKKFVLLPEPFSVAAGELTPTLKKKRKAITERYHKELELLYKEV